MPRIDFSLYLVTDRNQTAGRPLMALLREALAAGLRAVQLREKDLPTRALLELAREVRALTREYGAKLFINDRLDIVMAVEADGVHLRADSLPVAVARRLLGPDRLIGVSGHSVAEVLRAESEGADFALLGPVYATPSKSAYGAPIGLGPLEEAAQRCRCPVFAIGGITAARLGEVRRAGAQGTAVISAILSADSVASATRALLAVPHGTRRES
ncbi:MAG: thiamine phosphate synthase [Nitrospirota bacterium]|nr:thiamine phosphate synthase [Nitrospirota bacterium]MDE3117946.1 thiamine phosphate synthase [Nitrospirota bacterium]MDE3226303.1 thiamine phosphate synthase [Nitrospirota bacterium]MDE3243253.1 thiamine phosphate synthase [Nitrospirota bacterium]